MAQLPRLEQLDQRLPNQQGGSVSYRATSGQEDAPSEAAARFGEVVQNLAFEKQEQLNTTRAEDAWNKYKSAAMDLSVGETGYSNKKAGAAVNGNLFKTYSSALQDARKAIDYEIQDDDVRRRFNERANITDLQFKDGLLRHYTTENAAYQAGTAKASIDMEIRNVSVNWNDPNAVMASATRITKTIEGESRRQGYAPDDAVTKGATLIALGKMHNAVIQQAVASKQFDYAKGWFDANRNEIDTNTAVGLEKVLEDAGQKQVFNDFQTQFLAMKDSSKGLNQLYTAVNKDQTLDESRKNILIGRIQSRAEILDLRAERTRDRVENEIERSIGQVDKMTMQGFPPTAEQMGTLVDAAKGTALEPQVTRMIATANATERFRNVGFQEQEATISQMEASARKDPTKFDVTLIDRFKTVHENMKKQVADDPVTFAVRQGFVTADDPAAAPLNLGQPDPMQIAARFALARSVAGKYLAPVKPLTADETATLTGALKVAGPDQKREYFAKISQAAGSDIEGYKAIMGQLAPDNPVLATAGVFAGRGYMTPGEGRQRAVSDLIIRGEAILNPNKGADGNPVSGKMWPMPQGADEATMNRMFTNEVGNAYAGMPQAQSAAHQTAKSIYAAKVSDAGKNDGFLDSDAWRDSINLATGGVEKYRGNYIVLPYGMEYSDFKDGLHSRIDAMVLSGQFNPDASASNLKSIPVQSVGDGRYVLRAGDGVMVGKNGRPVVIDFNMPPVTVSGIIKRIPK